MLLRALVLELVTGGRLVGRRLVLFVPAVNMMHFVQFEKRAVTFGVASTPTGQISVRG